MTVAIAFLIETTPSPNVPDQWLAPTGLSMPPGFIASPLHRVVPHGGGLMASPGTVRSAYTSKSANCSSMTGRIAYHSAGIGTAVLRTKPQLR
jgi:hypothetical protein